MVVDPFSYAEHEKICNTMKYIAVGNAICLIAACDQLVYVAAASLLIDDPKKFYYYQSIQLQQYQEIVYGLRIFNIVKFTVLKIAYSIIVLYLAFKIRMELQNSANLAADRIRTKETFTFACFAFLLFLSSSIFCF